MKNFIISRISRLFLFIVLIVSFGMSSLLGMNKRHDYINYMERKYPMMVEKHTKRKLAQHIVHIGKSAYQAMKYIKDNFVSCNRVQQKPIEKTLCKKSKVCIRNVFLLFFMFWFICNVAPILPYISKSLTHAKIDQISYVNMYSVDKCMSKYALAGDYLHPDKLLQCPEYRDVLATFADRVQLGRDFYFRYDPSIEENAQVISFMGPVEVGVTQGFFDMKNPEEIAAIIGHEVGHIVAKNWLPNQNISELLNKYGLGAINKKTALNYLGELLADKIGAELTSIYASIDSLINSAIEDLSFQGELPKEVVNKSKIEFEFEKNARGIEQKTEKEDIILKSIIEQRAMHKYLENSENYDRIFTDDFGAGDGIHPSYKARIEALRGVDNSFKILVK